VANLIIFLFEVFLATSRLRIGEIRTGFMRRSGGRERS